MFLITECPEHGTKVTTDNASARIYRDMARQCAEGLAAYAYGHGMAHRAEGFDCWACCERMRIARDWEQEVL